MPHTYRLLPAAVVLFLGASALLAGMPGGPSCSCGRPAPVTVAGGEYQPAAMMPAPEESPRDAIRKVLDDQVAAWNRADLTAFMAGYHNSPNLSFFSGKTRTYGWQATLDRYRKRYQSEGKEMGKLRFEIYDIDVLGPGVALVRGKYQLQLKADKPEGLFTLVFARMPEGWRIVHDHTSS